MFEAILFAGKAVEVIFIKEELIAFGMFCSYGIESFDDDFAYDSDGTKLSEKIQFKVVYF